LEKDPLRSSLQFFSLRGRLPDDLEVRKRKEKKKGGREKKKKLIAI